MVSESDVACHDEVRLFQLASIYIDNDFERYVAGSDNLHLRLAYLDVVQRLVGCRLEFRARVGEPTH